jgi:hypothetical protein
MIDSKEEWSDLPGYEGFYEVSTKGNIKSLERTCVSPKGIRKVPAVILRPRLKVSGYLSIGIQKEGVRKFYNVHQLVAMAFLGHVPNGHKDVINHKNSVKDDNRLENIEIVDVRYNTVYSIDKSKTSSMYTGVTWSKRDSKWCSNISSLGKARWIGYFDDEYEAHLAYEKEKSKL